MSVPESQQKDNTPMSVSEFDAQLASRKNTSSENVLQESDMTPLTEGSTTSEEESGWLGGIGADFRNIANSLKGAVPPTIGAIGDIAHFVQRSALSVAAEIAQLERDSSDEEGGDVELRLPWEIAKESRSSITDYKEDEELKGKILALSVDHATFLRPFSVKGSARLSPKEESKFVVLDEPRIHLIRRLLEVDENLAATHAHLSGRSDVKETIFWTNYFFNCEKTRREHLEYVQSLSLVSTLSSPNEEGDNGSHSSQNSLIPADESFESQDSGKSTGDDSSYIQVNKSGIQSPPCSLKSVEDLVLVNKSVSKGK